MSWARKGITRVLVTRGAAVELVNLPEDCGVNGIDDLLALWGPDKVLELFKNAFSGGRLHVVLPRSSNRGRMACFASPPRASYSRKSS